MTSQGIYSVCEDFIEDYPLIKDMITKNHYKDVQLHLLQDMNSSVIGVVIYTVTEQYTFVDALEIKDGARLHKNGTMLLDQLKENYDKLYLHAKPGTEGFYEKNNFKPIGGGYYVWRRLEIQ